ncbi:class I SAM-dependent methyltransferase [Natronobiforma cellulositropha]|uniref:class I SAM-dependent methyltransferase n=1 Tax=Natronobiforma cellulositropha TaxID=1679076 RepID=UPI0021D5B1D9|nr:class I SAM-dependent methyltransferase [Natronobiforma cellulositropha]
MSEHDISHPVFAAVYDHLPDEPVMGPQREYLTAGLCGRVLDLGAGTGETFPYLKAADGPLEVHAVEPDPHMRRRAERRARAVGVAVDLRDARAESLPYPDDSFDAVLASVVFCTIEDPERALREVARVLVPGGEFRFVEHVRGDGWRASVQDGLTPLWKRAAGGCHLDRDTVALFTGDEAFSVLELERVDAGVFPAAPFVRGRLERRR